MPQEPESIFHWCTVRDIHLVCKGKSDLWRDEYRTLFSEEPPERLYMVPTKDLFTLLRMLVRRQKHREESDGN